MYQLSRLILIVSVFLAVSVIALLTYLWPIAGIILILGVIAAFKRGGGFTWAHGTARWAAPDDVPHLQEGDGLVVGYLEAPSGAVNGTRALFNPRVSSKDACQRFLTKKPRQLIKLNRAVHTAVFMPTGAGKGVSCILPFLLSSRESCLVIDIKGGENALITAEHRRSKFGHKINLLDPYNLVAQKLLNRPSDSLDPVFFIDEKSLYGLDDSRDIARATVERKEEKGDGIHFLDNAEAAIAAVCALVVHYGKGGQKSLQAVCDICSSPQRWEQSVALMCQSDAWGGMLARMGGNLQHLRDRELASTLSTIARFLRPFSTPAIAAATRTSTFDPAEALENSTTYLVLPPERVAVLAPVLRLWVGAFIRAAQRSERKVTLHIIADEAGSSLGKMDEITNALLVGRSAGIRLQLYYQDISQLKRCFPDGGDQGVLANCTQVFAGVNDLETARYVSERLGDETVWVDSYGASQQRSWGTSQSAQGGSSSSGGQVGTNSNVSQMARKLLKPEEVLTTNPRIAFTFAPGELPMWTWMVRYYEKEFKENRVARALATFAGSLLMVCGTGIIALVLALNVRPKLERSSHHVEREREVQSIGQPGAAHRDAGSDQGRRAVRGTWPEPVQNPE